MTRPCTILDRHNTIAAIRYFVLLVASAIMRTHVPYSGTMVLNYVRRDHQVCSLEEES